MAWNLKDEKEQEEYINNLGTEYRFGCYHEKKPEGNKNKIRFKKLNILLNNILTIWIFKYL